MKKIKKQVSDLEAIETYFTTGNEHRDKYCFQIYKEAEQEQIFESPLTPLWLINKIVSDCYESRKKPVQAVKKVYKVIEDKGLNYKQKCFVYDHVIKILDSTTWKDENGKEVSLNQIKELLDNEFMSLSPENLETDENLFDWESTTKHLETLPDTKDKIKFLIERRTEYKIENDGRLFEITEWTETAYDQKCDLKIKELKAIAELETKPSETKTSSNFSLSKSLSKIDYIRIINALSELRCFQSKDGTYPTKKDVMSSFGKLVNLDLNEYTNDLNKAFNSNVTIEQNIEIFDTLKKKTQELYLNKQNRQKK